MNNLISVTTRTTVLCALIAALIVTGCTNKPSVITDADKVRAYLIDNYSEAGEIDSVSVIRCDTVSTRYTDLLRLSYLYDAAHTKIYSYSVAIDTIRGVALTAACDSAIAVRDSTYALYKAFRSCVLGRKYPPYNLEGLDVRRAITARYSLGGMSGSQVFYFEKDGSKISHCDSDLNQLEAEIKNSIEQIDIIYKDIVYNINNK